MTSPSTLSPEVPFWKIWANPIVRRYARSRMRPVPMTVWALMTLLIAGFIFFVSRSSAGSFGSEVDLYQARTPIIPLLILQGIILFMLGAGQTAGGMIAESDEGVIDYQRLAPMKPLSKVLGYLFGLPIREWALFSITLPFSLLSMIWGGVPLMVIVQIYSVIIVAAMVYHMTGLLAGTVMKNRRAAYLGSIGLVFVLYTILPQISKIGLPYFKYLTINPVIQESGRYFVGREMEMLIETAENLVPTARFFNLDLPQAVFTLFSLGVLLFIMGMMLWRRWRKKESHLLGKTAAVSFFTWLQLVLIGNALPLIENGDIFPSNSFSSSFFGLKNHYRSRSIDPEEALIMVGAYGLTTIIMLWLMTFLITPTSEGLIRGWRRARKRGLSKLSFISDPASATPWVLLMALLGTIGWTYFATAILHSRHFPEYELTSLAPPAFAIVMTVSALAIQTIMEIKGRKFVGLFAIIAGVIPIMVGTVAVTSSMEFLTFTVWLFAICPLAWPFFAAAVALPSHAIDLELARPIPFAFWFWQALMLGLSIKWLLALRNYRQEIAETTKPQKTKSAD